MDIELKGGKTAPRLLLDLFRYDPRKLSVNNFNVLSDIPFHDEGQNDSAPPLPGDSCNHQWSLKRHQCELPEDKNYEPTLGGLWHFAACCSQCRSHLDFIIDFSEAEDILLPCPSEDRPLHHFAYQPGIAASRTGDDEKASNSGFAWVDTQLFKCTSAFCAAKLAIVFKPPRLNADWVAQLTDRYVIKTRAERTMAADPEKYEGIAIPSPVTVLGNLSTYINNALSDPEHSKKINSANKKFATSFGDTCSELLEYIGFVKEGEFWLPPRPETNQEIPYKDPIRIRLDDVQEEIRYLLTKEPIEQARSTKLVSQPEAALHEMKMALACTDYKKVLRSRTVDLTVAEHPYYAGLGAVADFHNDLMSFAYDRQIAVDPNNIPYYLECLQAIGSNRDNAEDLQTKAVIEETQDRFSLKDVRHAYSQLGLDIKHPHLTDELIIGTFQARITDAPKHEAEMRNYLRVIGQSRSSKRIKLVASQDVATYEQALHFLGAEDSTADEFVPSIFGMKVGEKPSDEHTARQAVALIANHRKSRALKTWLETGALGDAEMDVGHAYSRLDVSNRTVPDDLILTAYDFKIGDQPSQADDLNRALTAIAKSRDSIMLKERLGIDDGLQHKLSEWPVGIENIGNTCYLNSLLQFYFTIKPLRDLVLNAEKFKMPVDEQNLKTKRVGSRNVSRKEVDRAQRFIDELQRLFQDLITSPKASFKPNPDVARLTLLSSTKAELARRQSVIGPERPSLGSLGQINGMVVQGPAGPPSSQVDQDEAEMPDLVELDRPPKESRQTDQRSESSSTTLVDAQPTAGDPMALDSQSLMTQQEILEDKENLPPSKVVSTPDKPEDMDLQPLSDSSASRLNEQANDVSRTVDASEVIDLTSNGDDKPQTTVADANSRQPNRPPPFPPRPKAHLNESVAIKEAEYGAQQDVTEVIANVLFQLQCAIKPESVDESGEQLDQVKGLFFGKSKSYTKDKEGTIRTKEEYISDIKVNVASGPRDIYDALDGAFDVQDVEVGGGIEPQYTTISQLPPVLCILIQRAQFDSVKKTTFKSDNHLELKETIYMDRYMDSSEPDLDERRQERWAWKRQLAVLEKRKMQLSESSMGIDIPEVLSATRDYLKQVKEMDDEEVEIPSSLMENIEDAATEAKKELEALESQIKGLRTNIASQFSDLRGIPYRLSSVFIHVGSHNTGHYWIYIYDFTTKIWRKYNDEKVSQVKDTKEIFEAPGTVRPPTPYYLVYVKDEDREQLVDPVCRDVTDPAPEESQDTAMPDYEDVDVPNMATEMIQDTYMSIKTQNDQVAQDEPWNGNMNYQPEKEW